MKASIAIAVATAFTTATAFAQSVKPQANKAPVQVAQTGGGMAMGAGEATGVVA